MNDDNVVEDYPAEGGASPRWVRTWYGLPARVVISDDGLCDVALPGVPLPHPSLITR